MLVQEQEDDLMLDNEERRKRIWHNDMEKGSMGKKQRTQQVEV